MQYTARILLAPAADIGKRLLFATVLHFFGDTQLIIIDVLLFSCAGAWCAILNFFFDEFFFLRRKSVQQFKGLTFGDNDDGFRKFFIMLFQGKSFTQRQREREVETSSQDLSRSFYHVPAR